MTCCVCDTELRGRHTDCPYCGYGNAAVLTRSGDDSQEYRERLLSSLQNISVQGKKFQYNAEQNIFQEISSGSIFAKGICGTDCVSDIVRSSEWIAHLEGDTELSISYEISGKKKEALVPVHLGEQEGLWYLGLQINQNLRLELYLCIVKPDTGSAVTCVKLTSADLEFRHR